MSPDRLPSPGPSFVRTAPLRLPGPPGEPGRVVRPGMTRPQMLDDGWWLLTLWAEDDAGIVEAGAVAPPAGPPPGPPLQAIGPSLAGALAGLLAQADGRQLIRLRMPPAEDEARPWERPLMLLTAVCWDPVRASTMHPNELAAELMRAFRLSIEGL